MVKKAFLFGLLSSIAIFSSFEANSQYVYKKSALKKITKKEYSKKLSDKAKKEKQKRSHPFVYMYIRQSI